MAELAYLSVLFVLLMAAGYLFTQAARDLYRMWKLSNEKEEHPFVLKEHE